MERPAEALSCFAPFEPGGVCAAGLSFCRGPNMLGEESTEMMGKTGYRKCVLLE